MAPKKASISRTDSQTLLILHVGTTPLNIILTDDNPNNVKAVFNALLRELKKGVFAFELQDDTPDLYNNISTEYISQLNLELAAVYRELVDYQLVESERDITLD